MIHIQPMPRVTFRLNDRDYRRLKALSVQRKTSCSASIREGLNLLLHGKQKPLWLSEQQGRSEEPQGLRIFQLQKITSRVTAAADRVDSNLL